MADHNGKSYDAIFVGAGAIGLASAWRAAREGARVCVLERDRPASGATGVAAGMLAPVGEASWGEERLLALNMESLRRWPGFVSELEEDSGAELDFSIRGALHVALDRDEADELRRRYDLHAGLGLDSRWLPGSECRRLEPGLATAVRGGAHVPGEASLDPRGLVAALLAALERRGVDVHDGAEVIAASGGAAGWRLETADGRSFSSRTVVVCAGCWSGNAGWLPDGTVPPVRPVKGEILTLRAAEPPCERIVASERVYLVPRDDGRLIVGATVEERGFDLTLTAGGVHELLREAYRVIPEIAELELAETNVGLRPGSPDNIPMIGATAEEGLIMATGHFRNGVLQTPITADCISELLAGREPGFDLEPFSPLRFAASRSAAAAEVA